MYNHDNLLVIFQQQRRETNCCFEFILQFSFDNKSLEPFFGHLKILSEKIKKKQCISNNII